jgi:hypothetical protein
MKLFKHSVLLVCLVAMVVLLSSWGSVAHYKINNKSTLSFNQEMEQFMQWASILASHASDADIRKQWDPDEGPKHYIDIDNYPEFIANGSIPQTLDSVIALHGYNFVYDQGILPWATQTTFDSLQSCFERADWESAVLFASDLGHYVADGHMPFHITRNYNGQYSGNQGIHSRYESQMIGMYNSQINYEGYQISAIEDVNQYIFDYLYTNYQFIEPVLAADDYAHDLAGNTSSSQYYEALWEQTENITVALFRQASHSLAELIYTAWVNAGSPMISAVFSPAFSNDGLRLQNSPNPFSGITKISYSISTSSKVVLEIKDISGRPVNVLFNENKPAGEYQLEWDASDMPAGIYYAVLRTQNNSRVCKMVLVQ